MKSVQNLKAINQIFVEIVYLDQSCGPTLLSVELAAMMAKKKLCHVIH